MQGDVTKVTAGSDAFERAVRRLVNPRLIPLVACVLLAGHVALVLCHYPPALMSARQPLCSGDASYHLAECFEGAELLATGPRLWGYSPYFMAGYPFGLWTCVGGRHGYAFAPLIAPGAPVGVVFYLYAVVTAMLTPLLIALAAWIAGLNGRRVLISLGVAIVVYQLDSQVSYMWTYGNVAFPFVNGLGVVFAALLYTAVRQKRMWVAVAAGLVLGLALFLHQLTIWPLAAAAFLALWVNRRELTGLRTLYGVSALALGGALLLPWIFDLAYFLDVRAPGRFQGLQGSWKNLVMDFLSDRGYRQRFDRRLLFHVQLGLVVVGAYAGWMRAHRQLAKVLAGTAFASLAMAYAFSYFPLLREMEPYRYVVSFALFLVIPTALCAEEAARVFVLSRPAGKCAALCLGLMLLPQGTAYLFDIARRSPAAGLDRDQRAVVEYVKAHPEREGRVVCENGDLGNAMPLLTRREVIGGQCSVTAPLVHQSISVGRGLAFGAEVRTLTAAQLASKLDMYNTAYVVASAPALVSLMARVEGFTERFQSGSYRIFARDALAPGWLLGGASPATRVTARMNSICIDQAPPGRFVLKYNFLKTLQAPPGVHLFPAAVPGAALPFIGVNNEAGLARIAIANSGA